VLDENLCRGMEIVERLTLTITALLSLRDLLDTQSRAPGPERTIASEASPPVGATGKPAPTGEFLHSRGHEALTVRRLSGTVFTLNKVLSIISVCGV
jgi:hypothetical protein